MSIALIQQQMQGAITRHGTPPQLTGNPRGLEVYRTAWHARLLAALRTNYPVLHRVLGDTDFDRLADAYLQAHPSYKRSIRWFGDRLTEFVSARPESVPHPAIMDLIRFEWAICLAFDAADNAPLTFDMLAAVAPEAWPSLCFRVQPGYALLDLAWAVAPVWHALSDAQDPDAPVPPPSAHEHSVLVWRRGLHPMWRTVEPLEAVLLRAVESGESFAQMCELALVHVGEEAAAPTVFNHLQQWIADELLAV